IRPLLPGPRGASRRAWDRGRPREHLPVGRAVRAGLPPARGASAIISGSSETKSIRTPTSSWVCWMGPAACAPPWSGILGSRNHHVRGALLKLEQVNYILAPARLFIHRGVSSPSPGAGDGSGAARQGRLRAQLLLSAGGHAVGRLIAGSPGNETRTALG